MQQFTLTAATLVRFAKTRDLRARKLAQQQLAPGAGAAFAYTASHDLRAPLRGIEGFARILLDDFAKAPGRRGDAPSAGNA